MLILGGGGGGSKLKKRKKIQKIYLYFNTCLCHNILLHVCDNI
jgi:hypothetical protein